MEVGDGSEIAQAMGRSWTTHTGSASSAGRAKQGASTAFSLEVQAATRALLPLARTGVPTLTRAPRVPQVPDWDGVPDEEPAAAPAAQPSGGSASRQEEPAAPKQRSKKRKKRKSRDPEAAQETKSGRHRKKRKRKGVLLQEEADDDRAAHAPQPQESSTANAGIFGGSAPPAEASPKPKKAARKQRAEQGGAREQARPAAAAVHELPPEQEEQLEKGASLLLRKLRAAAAATDDGGGTAADSAGAAAAGSGSGGTLRAQYQKKLSGARFRYLNELLYTSAGSDSFQRFQKDPALFDVYHAGFREQVGAWPANPVDLIIKRLGRLERKAAGKGRGCSVADFGCGDAAIARSPLLSGTVVHSFDVVARNDWVTAADMAAVPLPEASVDTAVFSLSLMGTNWVDFICEAHRVLRPG